MDRLDFDDVGLTYQLEEAGERIVLVHASPFVSWYVPLVEQLTEFRPCGTGAVSTPTVAPTAGSPSPRTPPSALG